MADTSFPPSLTRSPLVSSLTETPGKATIRSEMDQGEAKVRRRFTGDTREFPVDLQLTRAQLAVFDEFYQTTTKAGSLSFEWRHPRTGATADFRFLDRPQYRPLAPRGDGTEWWLVSFPMEMLPGADVDVDPPSDGTPAGGGGWGALAAMAGAAVEDLDDEDLAGFAFAQPLIAEDASVVPDFVADLLVVGFGARAEDYPDESSADEDSASHHYIASETKVVDGGGISFLPGSSFLGGSGSTITPSYPGQWKPWYTIPTP